MKLGNARSTNRTLLLLAGLSAIVQTSSAQGIETKTYPFTTATPQYAGGITTGPDGALWFALYNQIGRTTTTGSMTTYSVPAGMQLEGITAGPDGALWVANLAGSIIRMTTAGDVTNYPVPMSNSEPFGITTGPNGNLWFTERAASKIGEITTTGAITEYGIPGSPDNVGGIVTGPDGALWFTTNSSIGRITTSGVVTEYSLPSPHTSGGSIAVGSDGALWFTEYGSDIGRITTAGAITYTEFLQNFPTGITAGADGAVWYTGQDGIGRVTPGMVVTQYPSFLDVFTQITSGPDGKIWYTDTAHDNIDTVPACGLGLNLTYANPVLDLHFSLGAAITGTATWNTWFFSSYGVALVYSQAGPSVSPPAVFQIPLKHIPPVGTVAVLSEITTSSALLCYDIQTINTGGTGATAAELQEMIRKSQLVPGLSK